MSENLNNKKEIPSRAEAAEKLLKEIFHNNMDVEIQCFSTRRGKALIISIDGLTNKDLIDRDIITPLKSPHFDGDIRNALKTVYSEAEDMQEVVEQVLNGNVAVIYDGFKKALIADFKSWDKRGVETPDAETVIRGPKEGFTENFRTNTSLLRRKIKTPDLIFEHFELGRQTRTAVAIVYIKGIVNKQVLSLLREKIEKINIDSVLETGHIEQLIDENTFSPVSGIGLTQKPDIAATKILEGRILVMCDGTPHVLYVPELFIENFHNPDDYYNRVMFVSILRFLRLFGLFTSVLLPGLFVAVLTFDQQMIPSVFLNNIIASTEMTPMPIGAEIFFLILMFELLRESGLRLPRTVGSAISIVGALIMGDAAVRAGIVSAPSVIVVALMAVSSFIVPNLVEFITVYRLIYLFLGGTMGLVGIGIGLVIMLIQLCSLKSFGVPVFSSFEKEDLRDSIIRFPLKKLMYRPSAIAKENKKRLDME